MLDKNSLPGPGTCPPSCNTIKKIIIIVQHQIILVRLIKVVLLNNKGFPGGASGKEPPCQWRDIRDVGLIPGLGRSPGEGNGKPFQHSCLENPKDRGAWWAMVHRVAKSWTQLKQLSTHACTPALTCFPSGSDCKESVSAVSESPAVQETQV